MPVAESLLIAPCGINCGVCRAHLRKKDPCSGCRVDDPNKLISRTSCKIKGCEFFRANPRCFCYACSDFPCGKLQHLDDRYRATYNLSVIQNLDDIQRIGLQRFLEKEKTRWACRECGGVICMHDARCSACAQKSSRNKDLWQ